MEKIFSKLEEVSIKDEKASEEIATNVFFIGQCVFNKDAIALSIEKDQDKKVELNIMMEKAKQKISNLLGLELDYEEILTIYHVFFKK